MSEASHFEAKHYAMRKSKDGTIISFVVHPDEVSPELNCLPIGCRVMIAWSQIGDDERQIGGGGLAASLPGEKGADRETVPRTAPEPKERKPFSSLPLAQQCAIRCSDKQFWLFLQQIYNARVDDEAVADKAVKDLINIKSKKELNSESAAAHRWQVVEGAFKAWLTDAQYADVRR